VFGRLNVNVALNRPTFAISVFIPHNPSNRGPCSPSNAVDGNHDPVSEKLDNSCFVAPSETNPWWAVDLGAALAVVDILFTNRGEGDGNLCILCHRHHISQVYTWEAHLHAYRWMQPA